MFDYRFKMPPSNKSEIIHVYLEIGKIRIYPNLK